MAFASLTAELNLNISNFATNLRKASDLTSNWARSYSGNIEATTGALKRHALGLKDVSRIVQGILISQAFYGATNQIQEATDEVWEFAKALDYAEVTYTGLFGNAKLATDFLSTLKDYSISTIFSFNDLTQASKKLLAYGIPMENLMHVMRGITNMTAMTGDATAMDRIAYAIGQIYAKGTLKAEEMRQLANAYVPIQSIVKEGFGLTDAQMGNIGDLGLKATDVIDLIVAYAEENFGDVADMAVYTVEGLHNKLKDTFLVVGQEMLEPFIEWYKGGLLWASKLAMGVRQIFAQGGAGGVFEAIFTDKDGRAMAETQQLIRTFIANVSNLFELIRGTAVIAGQYFWQFAILLMNACNVVIPVINYLLTLMLAFFQAILDMPGGLKVLSSALIITATAFTVYKAAAVAAAIATAFSSLVTKLAAALGLVGTALTTTAGKFLIFAAVAAGAIMLLLSLFWDMSDAWCSFSDSLASLGGKSSDDVLQVKDNMEETNDALAEFDKSFADAEGAAKGATGATNGLTDATKKAAKAAKSLLSFDEVFRLNEPAKGASGAGGGGGGTSPAADLSGIGAGMGGALGDLLKVPDTSAWADDFVDSLFGNIMNSIRRFAVGTMTGAWIGAMAGFALGALITRSLQGALAFASWGARIGALAGGAFATIWPEVIDSLENVIATSFRFSGTGIMVGALVGFVIGGLITKTLAGALTYAQWGAGIGSIIGAGFGVLWAEAQDAMAGSIASIAVGTGGGALVGGLLGLVLGAFITRTLPGALQGAAIGASIGGIVGSAIGTFWNIASAEMQSAITNLAVNTTGGALAGALVGFVIGALASRSVAGAYEGAMLGAKIGTALGAGLGAFWALASDEMKACISGVAQTMGANVLFGTLAGFVIGGLATRTLYGAEAGAQLGARIGLGLGAVFGTFWANASEEMQASIENAFTGANVGALVGGLLGLVIGAIIAGLSGAVAGAKIGAGIGGLIGTAIGGLWTIITEAFNSGYQSVMDAGGNVIEGFFAGILNAFAAVGDWLFNNVVQPFINWFNSLFGIHSPSTVMMESGNNIILGFLQGILNAVPNLLASIAGLAGQVVGAFGTWLVGTTTSLGAWIATTGGQIGNWALTTGTTILNWATAAKDNVVTFATTAKDNVTTFAGDTKQAVVTWAKDTKASIVTWAKDAGDKIKTWASNARTKVVNAATKMGGAIGSFTSNSWTKIKSFCSDTFSRISSWASDVARSVGDAFGRAAESVKNFITSIPSKISTTVTNVGNSLGLTGHATGGIFNREHVARFAEGGKAEAVIPLENTDAMMPFVNLIAQGVAQGLGPQLATANSGGGYSEQPPMYVGTLIADERGLRELERKMRVIRVQEARRGN